LYVISGRMRVRMDDGTEKEVVPGDAAVIPPGHDAWVIGNEPCVSIDFTAGATYGKK
jgi:quercetin dioxygenase-like cupin family protein